MRLAAILIILSLILLFNVGVALAQCTPEDDDDNDNGHPSDDDVIDDDDEGDDDDDDDDDNDDNDDDDDDNDDDDDDDDDDDNDDDDNDDDDTVDLLIEYIDGGYCGLESTDVAGGQDAAAWVFADKARRLILYSITDETTAVEFIVPFGEWPALAVDSDGYVHLAYHDT